MVFCPRPMLLKGYVGRERVALARSAERIDYGVDDALHETGENGTGTKGRTNRYHSRMDIILPPADSQLPSPWPGCEGVEREMDQAIGKSRATSTKPASARIVPSVAVLWLLSPSK